MAKLILEIYKFEPKKANLGIIKIKNLNKNDNFISTIDTAGIISKILKLKLKSMFQKIFI